MMRVVNPATTTGTILVVADSDSLCEMIEIILGRVGYRVLTTTDAAMALHLAQISPEIDLLMCDLKLPEMRGDELASRFATFHPSAAVVFLCNANGPLETSPPFELLAKPFTVVELREAVQQALRMRAASAELVSAS